MLGTRYINNGAITTYYDYRYINESWTAVDSFTVDVNNPQYKWGNIGFFSVDNRLFSYGFGVYEYISGAWTKILSPPSIMLGMYGNSMENLYAVGYQVVYQYDGTAWQRLTNFDNPFMIYEGAWTNGEETVIVGITSNSDPQKTVVFRGQ